MTFDIEELELAKEFLEEKKTNQIFHGFSPKIRASSQSNEKIVNFGKQSFIRGMHQAYADHRPFTLSPDIIWLLICQGFSRHVNKNSTELRKILVDHQGQKNLTVINNRLLNHPEEWQNVISSFTQDIKKNIKTNLVETLSPNFSTTNLASKIACEITILDTFKSFFEYTVVTCICGIPQITLEGNIEDWRQLKNKAQKLAPYNLNWWINSIIPVIDKFIETKQGIIDKPFWRNMYKIHTPEEYGASEKITGWITKFFPYNRFGAKTTLEELDINDLPDELTFTDFKWIIKDISSSKSFSMQFVAGFIGLEQCKSSMALKPQIGWFVCEVVDEEQRSLPEMDSEGILSFYQIDEMPTEILKYKHIYGLVLSFNGKVKIPYSIGKIEIESIAINGEITKKEMHRLRRILPFTYIYFNKDEENAYQHTLKKNYFFKAISKLRNFIRV